MSWAQQRIRVGGASFETFLVPRRFTGTSAKRGCLYFWGRGNSSAILPNALYWRGVQHAVANAGIPVYSSDFVSSTHWGNDAAIAETSVARTNMNSVVSPKTDKVLIIAISMGAPLALSWARQNPTQVAAIALITPALDLQNVHDTTAYTAEMETAHGGAAAFTAALPTHSPTSFASELTSIPIKVWASENDPICSYARAQAFATASGAEFVSLGAVGHTAGTLDGNDVARFLGTYAE